MTEKDEIRKDRRRYTNKIKEVDKLILQLQEERREYTGIVKVCDEQMQDLLQGRLYF